MSPLTSALVVFLCCFGGAMAGMWISRRVPASHLDEPTREVVNVSMNLVATMTALLLGLVIASAKASYDEKDESIRHSAVKLLTIDHLLSEYGEQTRPIRDSLRAAVLARIEHSWVGTASGNAMTGTPEVTRAAASIETRILALEPQTDTARELQARASGAAGELLETRWLGLIHTQPSLPVPFFVLLLSWLTILFVSFGVFSPGHGTVVASMFLCALVVASAVFLILELDEPFAGMLRVSDQPLRYALDNLSP